MSTNKKVKRKMTKDYIRFKVPKGSTSVKIFYDAEKNSLKADWKVDTEKPPDKPLVEKPDNDKVTLGNHIKSLFTGQGKGAFADPIEDEDNEEE